MIDSEKTRDSHRALAAALLPEMLTAIDWPRERLAAHRQRALRELLVTAVKGSAWHRERLLGSGIDPQRCDETDVGSLPTMTKSDLVEHFDAIATDPRITLDRCERHISSDELYLDDEFVVIASGGTSGVRSLAVSDWDDMARCFAANLRLPIRWGIRTGAFEGPPRTASVTAAPGPHASRFIGRIFGQGDQSVFSATDPLPDIVDGLNRSDPEFLIVYSSLIPRLLSEFEAGRLAIRPRAIMPAAEPFLPEHSEAVDRVWGCGVFTSWAATEVGLLGVGSGFDDGMLLADDLAIVELVDEHNQPVRASTRAAKVLVTPLYRRALPVIRYEITDQLTAIGNPASCGSSFTLTSTVEGRLDDQFEYGGGHTVHPHLFRSSLGRAAAIREYQVQQTPQGAIIRFVAHEPVDTEPIVENLTRELERTGLPNPIVEMQPTSAIDRSPDSAKLRRFVPLS